MVYLINLKEKSYIKKKNKWLPKIKEWIDANDPGSTIIPFSGEMELKLMDIEDEEREAFCKENNVTRSVFILFLKIFCWTRNRLWGHCPFPWVLKPGWFFHLNSYLLDHGDT